MENDLAIYASAGAYSFLLSALPLLLMVVAILVRIFHTSPERIVELLSRYSEVFASADLERFLASVTSFKSVGILELVLGLSIFWMARRFFASIQQGMRAIYRKRGKWKPVKETLTVIAAEIILVVMVSAMVIFLIAGNAFFRTALARSVMSPLLFTLLRSLFRFLPLIIIFLYLFLSYSFTPRKRPPWHLSLVTSFACTVSFAAVQAMYRGFVNITKYNLVYGFLSNVIVILLEVFMFFFLFLFFAQYQYVIQFYESFLLSRLLLLSGKGENGLAGSIEWSLFAKPAFLYRRYAVRFRSGERVFSAGEESSEFYYVWSGRIEIAPTEGIAHPTHASEGETFGELSGLLNGRRAGTARASEDSILLRLPESLLREAIEVNGAVSRKTLNRVTEYVKSGERGPFSAEE
jgi:membrane protein